jgi:hypothetical protein
MKTTSQKNSFGGGYGINRKLSAESHLKTALPPHANVRVHPGVGKKHHKNVSFTQKQK